MQILVNIADFFTKIMGNYSFENWYIFDPKHPLLFNSALFLVLFSIFYGIYTQIINKKHLRTFYVVAFSLFFYYKSSGWYFWILLFSSVVDYSISIVMHKQVNKQKRFYLLLLSLISNLGLLAYFKYTNFFIDNWNGLTGSGLSKLNIILPVGISFYTFQTLSYTIDVYRKELAPTKKFIDFLFFVSFFPQLVAGPIVRAKDFIPQIYKKLKLSKADFNLALFLIIGGLIKKAIISDYISVNFVDRVFDNPNLYTPIENILASYGYALQIYADFSGYSDIAIGIALLMGFRLPVNFRTPYQSGSITEFWRRWHISLSSWLRDYLYISLGGNRKGKIRTYVNLFLTMLLGGLWHGASWKFVFWGMLHGSALAVERFFKQYIRLPKNIFVRAIQVFLTFHFVIFAWLFFRAKDFSTVMDMLHNIGSIRFDMAQFTSIILAYKNVMLLMLFGFLWHFIPKKWEQKLLQVFSVLPIVAKALLFGLLFWAIYVTASAETQPFIYFQF